MSISWLPGWHSANIARRICTTRLVYEGIYWIHGRKGLTQFNQYNHNTSERGIQRHLLPATLVLSASALKRHVVCLTTCVYLACILIVVSVFLLLVRKRCWHDLLLMYFMRCESLSELTYLAAGVGPPALPWACAVHARRQDGAMRTHGNHDGV